MRSAQEGPWLRRDPWNLGSGVIPSGPPLGHTNVQVRAYAMWNLEGVDRGQG